MQIILHFCKIKIENLALINKDKHLALVQQIEHLIGNEKNIIANLANISAHLKMELNLFWVGFYFVDKSNEKELVLGPFQGPIACARIPFGKGVCGTSWSEKKSILVSDVNQFEGHIACNALSKSELVCPVIVDNKVVCILDADSEKINGFCEKDLLMFESICSKISSFFAS